MSPLSPKFILKWSRSSRCLWFCYLFFSFFYFHILFSFYLFFSLHTHPHSEMRLNKTFFRVYDFFFVRVTTGDNSAFQTLLTLIIFLLFIFLIISPILWFHFSYFLSSLDLKYLLGAQFFKRNYKEEFSTCLGI